MSLYAVKLNSFGYLTSVDNDPDSNAVGGSSKVTSPVVGQPPQKQLGLAHGPAPQKAAQVGGTDDFMKIAYATVNGVNSPVADYDFMDCTF